jgi:hypothetical protein
LRFLHDLSVWVCISLYEHGTCKGQVQAGAACIYEPLSMLQSTCQATSGSTPSTPSEQLGHVRCPLIPVIPACSMPKRHGTAASCHDALQVQILHPSHHTNQASTSAAVSHPSLSRSWLCDPPELAFLLK